MGQDARAQTYGALIGGLLTAAGEPQHLSVATLNYDGLAHSVLLDHVNNLADLGHGLEGARHEIADGVTLLAQRLRYLDDIPAGRLRLLQLHGSLGWLIHPDTGVVWAFRLDDLRHHDYWDLLQCGATQWQPSVVLTDRKGPVVGSWPFDLAYRAFHRDLLRSERWLIAGYGLGDEPVNRALTEARQQACQHGDAPRLLVIGHDEPATLRQRVHDQLNWPNDHTLHVDGSGVPEAVNAAAWQEWITEQ